MVEELSAQAAVVRLLQELGEDPNRDGLRETPRRVVKALGELTAGYGQDPAAILRTEFDVAYDEMIVVRGVPFASLCEHHMLPFTGHATVAYVPDPRRGKVVGLSKLARLVECFARRLQVQERLTADIAGAIEQHLEPLGVGVLVTARHTCMSLRGVRSDGEMVTSRLTGVLRDEAAARQELLFLHGNP